MLDLFTVALRQIGSRIARSQLEDAVEVLLLGDGSAAASASAETAGAVIALDSGCALEMAVAQEVSVDYDKLIDCQLERASITSIAGFARLFPQAVQVLTLRKGD